MYNKKGPRIAWSLDDESILKINYTYSQQIDFSIVTTNLLRVLCRLFDKFLRIDSCLDFVESFAVDIVGWRH